MDQKAAMTDSLFETDLLRLKRCRYGHFLYYRNDTAVGAVLDRHGEFGEDAHTLLLPLIGPGDTVIDVGANIGTSAVAFAHRVGPQGRVYAFEPQQAVYTVLCANLALNGLRNVTPYPYAVGRQPGTAFLPVVDYAVPGNYGAVALAGQETPEGVGIVPLDQLSFPRCALLKVDVEGAENDVVQGALGLLRRDQPLVYVEFNDIPSNREMLGTLLGLGYRLYWHPVAFVSEVNFFGAADTAFQRFDINILGVPPRADVAPAGLRPLTDPTDQFDPALAPRIATGGY
jgi:FkbM family methyltransferase